MNDLRVELGFLARAGARTDTNRTRPYEVQDWWFDGVIPADLLNECELFAGEAISLGRR